MESELGDETMVASFSGPSIWRGGRLLTKQRFHAFLGQNGPKECKTCRLPNQSVRV